MFNSQNVIFYLRSQSRNSVTDDEHENDGDDEIGETETSVNDDLDVYHSTSEGLSEDELVTKFGKLSEKNESDGDDEIDETETSTANDELDVSQSSSNLYKITSTIHNRVRQILRWIIGPGSHR
jgi:hypothetical protein